MRSLSRGTWNLISSKIKGNVEKQLPEAMERSVEKQKDCASKWKKLLIFMYHRLECGFKVTCPNVYYMKMEITENWSLSLENTAFSLWFWNYRKQSVYSVLLWPLIKIHCTLWQKKRDLGSWFSSFISRGKRDCNSCVSNNTSVFQNTKSILSKFPFNGVWIANQDLWLH